MLTLIEISSVKPYLFFPGSAKNLLLCRVETKDGIYGWGESYVSSGKEKVVEAYINAMAPYMIGRSPFNVRHTGHALFDDFMTRRSTMDFYSAWSAIEIAMWDIIGKYTNQPVYNLIGGCSRKSIRVYANGWWAGAKTTDELVERAVKVKEMGFAAIKWDPFNCPWRTYISKAQENEAYENVKAVYEAVGPEVDLLIEVHRRLSPYHAISFAKRIEEFSPFWYEEPTLSDNIDLVVEAKKQINIPVVTGETLYTKSEFKDVFEKRAADIINPDTCICNGILGMMEIATMAEPYNISFSPHNFNSTTAGLAATLHISAAASNFLIAELFVNIKPDCDEIMKKPFDVVDGFIELPTEPGLGFDIDMEKLLKKPPIELRKEFPYKGVAQYYDEFPCR